MLRTVLTVCASLVALSSCASAKSGWGGPVSHERAQKIRLAADEDNERSYQAALKAMGLVLVDPPGPQQRVEPGESPPEGLFITGHQDEGEVREDAEFARDAEGTLWHIERQPQVPNGVSYTIPGCFANNRGGAQDAPPKRYRVGYVAAEGAIAGTKHVAYSARAVSFHPRRGPCDRRPPRP